MKRTRYYDEKNIEYYIGIIRGRNGKFGFATLAYDNNYFKQKVVRIMDSKFLPWQATPEEAQDNLDAYALRKGWTAKEDPQIYSPGNDG